MTPTSEFSDAVYQAALRQRCQDVMANTTGNIAQRWDAAVAALVLGTPADMVRYPSEPPAAPFSRAELEALCGIPPQAFATPAACPPAPEAR